MISHGGPYSYPKASRCNQVDDYHGVTVADPFRWLEDPTSNQTTAWISAQNAFAQRYLSGIPGHDAIADRLKELIDYPRRGLPWRQGRRYFYYANSGMQNQHILYTASSPNGHNARAVIDLNSLSTDGTVAMSAIAISWDGNTLAYALSSCGSDWQEWHIRNIETGEDMPETLKWCKVSQACWDASGKGFYYYRYDEPAQDGSGTSININEKLYYHLLGTQQKEDILAYERPDHKDWSFQCKVTGDGAYLVITTWSGTGEGNHIFLQELQTPDKPITELLGDEGASYTFLGSFGCLFWFQTTLNAPRGRVISVDRSKPVADHRRCIDVIPECKHSMESVDLLDHKFVVRYLQDAHSKVKIFNTKGRFVQEIKLPGRGSVAGFTGGERSQIGYYVFESYTTPRTIYRYNIRTNESKLLFAPAVTFSPADYSTKQVFYRSKDGTIIPMFISYRKGLKLDGNNPTYLYGYGGFFHSLTPDFSTSTIAWMELGGIYAIANLRGGGEYGADWYAAGTGLQKQNVFDDFIAAADWLIDKKYTSTAKLAIGGASNGGLLVGACLTQRPELFGCAVPEVGVLDMLRYHLFTIGWSWKGDYGSSDDAEEFAALLAYSPLHNIKEGVSYPPTLVLTALHDDRVVPAHSFKFTAALQAAQAGSAPVVIRIEDNAGHGAGKPTARLIEEDADRWAFILNALDALPATLKSEKKA